MRLEQFVLRVTAAVAFFNVCAAKGGAADGKGLPKKARRVSKYPSKLYDLYQNQIEKNPKLHGEWSNWSPWSPCSRTCGGGITQQTRHCITRSADSRFVKRQRRRRQNWQPSNECVGVYKRLHLCNTQDCPDHRDFRLEQCAAFNERPFKGKTYLWEPFYQGKLECALNCRPKGMTFYATLNRTVIDGTPCHHPVTSTGKTAPKGTKGVCIDGYCKSVNSQGVVGGNDENPHHPECHTCLRGQCRTVNGIYTRPDLPSGYSLVAQVPKGACGLHVQQIKHTRNFLALKISENGTYIINGDWNLGPSRSVEASGTKITYIKQDTTSLETIAAPGPLATPIDIMVASHQANPGIKYRYSLPIDEEAAAHPVAAPPLIKRAQDPVTFDARILEQSPVNSSFSQQRDEPNKPVLHPGQRRTRLRRRNFHWKVTGLTPCTKSCGGGTQSYVRTCYRTFSPTHQVPIHEKRCAHLDAPALTPLPCNVDPCPPPTTAAKWGGAWGQCSVSCGEGVQQFIVLCKKEMEGRAVVVSEAQCGGEKPGPESRACQERECDNFRDDNELSSQVEPPGGVRREWNVGPWSPCSVSCGTGHRTRSVICPSGQCHAENRPAHAEYCNQGACQDAAQSASRSNMAARSSHVAATTWLVTEWSHCSVQCGTGNQTRYALCEHDYCTPDSKPEISRECSSEKQCDGQWYAGPWGDCSDSCNGPAKQRREVLCIAKIRGVAHVTNEMVCPAHSRPYEEQSCLGICPSQWFVGDWQSCEGINCPQGIQRREVKCLDIDKRASNRCPEDKIPVGKRSCACESNNFREPKDVGFSYKLAQDEPVDRSCVDKISKCRLAVQARLCSYPFYTKNCCDSCKKAQQDFFE